jgi:hypothetical protein
MKAGNQGWSSNHENTGGYVHSELGARTEICEEESGELDGHEGGAAGINIHAHVKVKLL